MLKHPFRKILVFETFYTHYNDEQLFTTLENIVLETKKIEIKIASIVPINIFSLGSTYKNMIKQRDKIINVLSKRLNIPFDNILNNILKKVAIQLKILQEEYKAEIKKLELEKI